MPGSDPRLADFLEWLADYGVVETSRIPDYRRFAIELFGLSGGHRVTEAHILKLLDSYADTGAARTATPLIEEVGETLLRFEAARKSSPPPAPRRTPVEPFTVRPDERVASDLRPPDSARQTGPEKNVVSFSASGSHPIPPEANQSRPPVEQRRATGSVFRCRKCQTMVTAGEGGVCPRCGTPAARISSGQVAISRRSPPSTTTGTSWILPAVLGVVAFFLAFQFGPDLIDKLRHPSQPAAGTTSSPHLGVRLTLPDGWRHSTDGDRAPTTSAEGLEAILPEQTGLRASRYFHGSSRDPDAELILTVVPRASRVTDEAFRAWAERAARGRIQSSARELSGIADLTLESCNVMPHAPPHVLRCKAQSGRSGAYLYVWPARTTLAFAVYLDGDVSTDEADEIIAALDLS